MFYHSINSTFFFSLISLSISSGTGVDVHSSISDPGAMRDATAAAPVRVGLLPLLAIVVGITAAAAWNRVGSQGCVANELMPSGKKSALVRLHQQLGFLANAFTH